MSNKLWGGRFAKEVDASIIGWSESVTIDGKMVVEDLWGSLAHVSMLGYQSYVGVSTCSQAGTCWLHTGTAA